MIKLGKKVQYGLVALVHLDRVAPGTRVSTRDLSERYGIPEPHLGKVLQRMGRAKLLRSVQGVQGGYELACRLDALKLGTLMRAVEGLPAPEPREPHPILAVFPACFAHGLARELENQVGGFVEELNVADILNRMDVAGTELEENLA